MKQFAWFIGGVVGGVLALLCVQGFRNQVHQQKPSFEDLKIAVAPVASPWPTPTPSPIGTRTVNASTPMQFFDGQWTTKINEGTPRPRAVQAPSVRTIPSSVAPAVSTPVEKVAPVAVKPKGEEVAIFLDRQQQINTRSGSYRIFVHDHGSETISVSVDYGGSTRVKKAMGTDSVGDNKVLIFSDGRVMLYHVNSPRAPHNCCLIEVVAA